MKCFPADPDDPATNREPTAEERATCFGHRETELRAIDPAAVVTTGRHATAAVLEGTGGSLDGFLDRVLDPVDLPAFDATLLPGLHPSQEAVWRGRLGHPDRAAYVVAVRTALTDALRR